MNKPLLQVKTVLGFDFGLKRIGVAIGQIITKTATPLPYLNAQDGAPKWENVKSLIEEWSPQLLIVGCPLHMDGSEQPLTKMAKRFGNRLHGRFNLPVEWVDERLTSYEAQLRADEQGYKLDSGEKNLDSYSATIILEQWLSQR